NQLARLRSRDGEAHAVHDVVQTPFEKTQQVLARIALLTGCLGVIGSELALQKAVDALDLLFLAQLHAVIRKTAALGAGRTVLARLLFELALGVDRARGTLETQVGAFATRQLA